MLLKVPSVLQDVPDLLISVLVTVTQPTEDGEVLYRGSHMLAAVAQSLPAQVGHHELLLRQLLHAIETQLKAPKAPYRGISCLLLCLYDLGELVNEQYDDLNQSEASVWLAVDQ